jgi:hypothetical protein
MNNEMELMDMEFDVAPPSATKSEGLKTSIEGGLVVAGIIILISF